MKGRAQAQRSDVNIKFKSSNMSKLRRNGCWTVAEWNFDVIHIVDFVQTLKKHCIYIISTQATHVFFCKMHPPFSSPAWPFWCLHQKQTSDVLALCTWVEVAVRNLSQKGGWNICFLMWPWFWRWNALSKTSAKKTVLDSPFDTSLLGLSSCSGQR